jgi:hypothetical protein
MAVSSDNRQQKTAVWGRQLTVDDTTLTGQTLPQPLPAEPQMGVEEEVQLLAEALAETLRRLTDHETRLAAIESRGSATAARNLQRVERVEQQLELLADRLLEGGSA